MIPDPGKPAQDTIIPAVTDRTAYLKDGEQQLPSIVVQSAALDQLRKSHLQVGNAIIVTSRDCEHASSTDVT